MTNKLHGRKVLDKEVIFHTSQLLKQLKKSPNGEDMTKKLEKIIVKAPFLTDSSDLKYKSKNAALKEDIIKKYGLPGADLKKHIKKVRLFIKKDLEPRSYKRWKEYCRSYKRRANTKVKKIEIEISLLESLVDYMRQNHSHFLEEKGYKAENIGKSELNELIQKLLSGASKDLEEF